MVVAWARTNADLNGFGINRADGAASDGAQSAPAIADNTGEFFAVAWLNGSGAAATVRAKFYDSLGNPDELLPGPIDLNDATGSIVSGPVLAGWIEGYTVAWRERASAGEPVLYRARLVGPEAPIGQEFTLQATDPDGHAVLNQDKLSLAGWEQIVDPVAETVAVGFNAVWVSSVDAGGGATLDRVMLQRFEVPLDEAGNPQPAVAAGIDGRAGLGSDAPIILGAGRDPAMAALHDGEQIIVWIDGDNRVQGRFLNPDGTDVPGVDLADFATVAAGQGVEVASFGVGSFGVFWVAAEGAGLVIKGQTWGFPDGAANWGPLGPVQTVVALPAGFDGRFSVAGFGEGSDAGLVSYSVADAGDTRILAQAFDPNAVPIDAPFAIGAEGGSTPNGGMAGLIGERAAVVWQDAADSGDVRVQIIDTRDPGLTLVGDRDRLDGRVDERLDVLVGTVGDDMIVTDRGDTRGGRFADDEAHGVIGDDTLYGGGGDDLLDGGEERLGDAGPETATDLDVVAYRGGRGAYSVTVNGDGSFTVKDMRQGIAATDGMDTIAGFERLAFDSQIAGPALTVGSDAIGLDSFFQALPPVAPSDGTPAPWGLENTAAFAVNTDPAGLADLGTGAQTAPSAVGLLGGFAFAWQSGNAVQVKAYDTLGQSDAAFGGGAAASVFTLTDGVGSVVGPVAAMAGETGVVAVWQETEGDGPSAIKGRFVSAVTGLVGDGEFQVKAAPAGAAQRDAAVAGYEVVDAENDTAEYGFVVGYTEGAGSDGVGRVLLDRMTLFVRSADNFDVGVAGERAPTSVGLDGFAGVGSGDDLAAHELSAAGRDLSLDTLHDGEAVASWIEGDAVKVKVLVPEFDPVSGITAFDAGRPVIDAVTGIDAGTKQQIVGLGFNFAVAYMQGGVFKAQLYTGSGGAWTRSDVVSFGEMPAGTTGDVRLVTTDLDGTAFTMFVEAVVDGTATVHGQHFDGAGHKVGQPFVAFQAPVSLAGGGAGGFSAAPLDDGRIVIATEGQAAPGADEHGIVGALLDTRIPGEPITGPRDGAPRDVLVGTTGDDAIDGRVLEDELHGGLGGDVLLGGSESDTLFGERGGDTLLGGSEEDSLEGGEGDDLLLGGFGADTLVGGTGSDTVSMQGEFARFRVDLAAGTVQSDRNPATGAARPGGAFAVEDRLTGVENATGGEAADTLTGDAGGNLLEGSGSNDSIDGGQGVDTAVFRGNRAEYTASSDAATGTLTISHIGSGADGVDRLTNVEQFRFADGTVGLPALLAGTDLDEAPVAGDPVTASVDEDVAVGAVVGTVSAADPEGARLTYALTTPDVPFAVNPQTGEISTAGPLDHETTSSYVLALTASDGTNAVPLSASFTVTDVDEAPVAAPVPPFSVAENAAAGAAVGTVTATDPEGADVTYRLAKSASALPFAIDASTGAITITAPLDREAQASYTLNAEATAGTHTTPISVRISVADVNEAPVAGAPVTASIAEDVAIGTVVGTVSATDPETPGRTTYTLATRDVPFAVNAVSGAITTTAALDFETFASYSLALTASDGVNTTALNASLTITDVDEPPVAGAPASLSVDENLPSGTVVGTVSAADPEGTPLTYALATPNVPFAVDPSTGLITTTRALDHETAASYTLPLTASDGTNTTPLSATITVADVDEAPAAGTPVTPLSIAENLGPGAVVGSVLAVDPEGGSVSYVLATEGVPFTVDFNTGEIKTTAPLDHEGLASYTLGIEATDETGHDTLITVPVSVTDVDEAPVVPDAPVFTPAQASVREDAALGTVLGRFSVENDGDSATVLAGPSRQAYEVAEDGTVTLTALLDFETARSVAVSATAAFADASDPNAHSPTGNGTVEVADLYEAGDPGQPQPSALFTVVDGVALVQGTSVDFRARDGGLAFTSDDGAVTTVVPGVERAVFADGTLSFGSDAEEAFLQRLYLGLLEREADGRGIAYHAERLESGATLGQVAQGFAESPEYIGNANGVPSDRAFVESLYVNFLGRQADSAGADFWTGHLASGAAARGDVATGFALSAEAQGKYDAQTSRGVWVADWEDLELDALYIAGLGREADPGARAAVTAALEAGTLTRKDLAEAIVNSDEYELRHGPDAAGAVNVIFRDALERDAEQAARDFFTGTYNTQGAAAVLLAITGSAEFAVIEDSRASGDHLFA